MALANLNTADFLKGDGVTQADRVIEIVGAGEGTLYNLTSPTTVTVGNLVSGTNISGWTSNEILQAILTGVDPTGNIVAETGDALLTEIGDLILIE
jgi:hypothetical protein